MTDLWDVLRKYYPDKAEPKKLPPQEEMLYQRIESLKDRYNDLLCSKKELEKSLKYWIECHSQLQQELEEKEQSSDDQDVSEELKRELSEFNIRPGAVLLMPGEDFLGNLVVVKEDYDYCYLSSLYSKYQGPKVSPGFLLDYAKRGYIQVLGSCLPNVLRRYLVESEDIPKPIKKDDGAKIPGKEEIKKRALTEKEQRALVSEHIRAHTEKPEEPQGPRPGQVWIKTKGLGSAPSKQVIEDHLRVIGEDNSFRHFKGQSMCPIDPRWLNPKSHWYLGWVLFAHDMEAAKIRLRWTNPLLGINLPPS